MPERILELDGVTMRFGGVSALDDVSLHVERGEVDMPALCFDDMIAACRAQNLRDAQSGAGAAHRDDAQVRQWAIRSGEVDEVCVGKLGDGMANCAEIIDQNVLIQPQTEREI